MRVIAFLLLAVVGCKAQTSSTPTVVSDKMYYIKFDSGSLHFLTGEAAKIEDVAKAYSTMESQQDYVFIFSGVCSESEIKSDSFLGVKRSKVLRDFLAEKYGISKNAIRIADDQIFPNSRKIYGVTYFLQRSP